MGDVFVPMCVSWRLQIVLFFQYIQSVLLLENWDHLHLWFLWTDVCYFLTICWIIYWEFAIYFSPSMLVRMFANFLCWTCFDSFLKTSLQSSHTWRGLEIYEKTFQDLIIPSGQSSFPIELVGCFFIVFRAHRSVRLQ